MVSILRTFLERTERKGQIWGRISQEVRINGLLHLHTPFIPFDPNFQRDIQVGGFLKFPNHLPLISENHRKKIFPLPKLKQRDFASRLFFADAWGGLSELGGDLISGSSHCSPNMA